MFAQKQDSQMAMKKAQNNLIIEKILKESKFYFTYIFYTKLLQ